MMAAVNAYLALRRAAGFDMFNAGFLLASYASFATERNEAHISAETAIAWANRGPSVAQRDERLKTICRFARYIRAEDHRHALPPANYFGWRKRRRVPYIYSEGEISRLLQAAGRLGPAGALRPHTYSTLLALLATTGLRISEALKLRFTDITADGLLIRETKFKKTRLVPLHDTVMAGLNRYVARRRQVGAGDDHVFIGDHGRSLPYSAVQSTFQTLLRKAGLWPPSGGRRPRLHDMRHAFAVKALRASPAGRSRISEHMVALATYLGHVNIYSTYWYLEATPELLQDVADIGESFLCEGARS
jgi:integrase